MKNLPTKIYKGIFLLISWMLLTSCSSFSTERAPLVARLQTMHAALTSHNQFRARHHAPKLIWDETLARYAENYASKCHFRHSYGEYGENIAEGYSTVNAVAAWYNENRYYSYKNPGFSHTTGHFTQVVWKSSEKLGCAVAICNGKNGTYGKFLVCEYDPPGNVDTPAYFAENVLPSR